MNGLLPLSVKLFQAMPTSRYVHSGDAIAFQDFTARLKTHGEDSHLLVSRVLGEQCLNGLTLFGAGTCPVTLQDARLDAIVIADIP